MFNEVKDSGERQEFETGAVRDSATGKGRYDLIPVYALKRLARHYENGAKKYGDNNWKKGMPLRRYYDSAMRHLGNWMEGNRDEDHLAAVLFNVMAIIETEKMIEDEELPTSLLVEEHQKTKKPPKNTTTIPANNARLEINGQHINNTWDNIIHSYNFGTNPQRITFSGEMNQFPVMSGVYNPEVISRKPLDLAPTNKYEVRTFHRLYASDLFNTGTNVHYEFDEPVTVNNGDTVEYLNSFGNSIRVQITRANGSVEYYNATNKSGHADQHKKGN